MKRFKIKSRASDKFFWVMVYANLKSLRKDIRAYDLKTGSRIDKVGETLGVCHPYERVVVEEGKLDRVRDNIGLIRLAKNYLSTEIVSHELIHASIWLYRLEFGVDREFEGSSNNADFGNTCSEDEEQLAHIYGQMFRDMNKKLHDYNYW